MICKTDTGEEFEVETYEIVTGSRVEGGRFPETKTDFIEARFVGRLIRISVYCRYSIPENFIVFSPGIVTVNTKKAEHFSFSAKTI